MPSFVDTFPEITGLAEFIDQEDLVNDEANLLCYPQTKLLPGPFLARHLRPIIGLWTVLKRPTFQVGKWSGSNGPYDYKQSDIDSMVDSFPTVVADLRPWITIHHRPAIDAGGIVREPLMPVLGHVSNAYKNETDHITARGDIVPAGELVYTDWVNVAPGVVRAIKRRNFARPSAGLENEWQDNRTGKVWPWCIQHVSLEGGEAEAVFTLDDLDRFYLKRSSKSNQVSPFQYGSENVTTFSGRTKKVFVVNFSMEGPKMPLGNVAKWEDLVPVVAELQEGQAQVMGLLNKVAEKVGVSVGNTPATATPDPTAAAANAAANAANAANAAVNNATGNTAVQVQPVAAAVKAPATFSADNAGAGAGVVGAAQAAPATNVVALPVAGQAVANPQAVAPANAAGPVPPVSNATKVTINGVEYTLDELLQQARKSGEGDAAKRVVALEQQLLQMAEEQRKTKEAEELDKVASFMRKNTAGEDVRIPVLRAPAVEHALKTLVQMELAARVRNTPIHFSRNDGVQQRPSEIIMELINDVPGFDMNLQTTSVIPKSYYKDYPQPPVEGWNSKSVAKFTREHATKNKKDFNSAYNELADIYGQPFVNGVNKSAV